MIFHWPSSGGFFPSWAAAFVLFFYRRPSDITGFVIAVIVGISVDGVIRGRRISHVLVKGREIVKPVGVNRNSATPVVRIGGVCGGKTAIFHSSPDVVDASSSKPMFDPRNAFGAKLGQSFLACFMEGLFVKTSAGVGVARTKVAGFGPSGVAAIALTQPMNSLGFTPSFRG